MSPAGRSIAIVGSGPSGCYLAQALLKAAPDLQVDVIDALPVPYGLVRYGVATDHQGTKAVTRQFARIFERQGARFFGNVTVGRDVTLDALRHAYSAVVLATGLSQDRRLGIQGDDLPGVHGAGALTRALNEHPDVPALPDLGTDPLIIGHGNVALDLIRVLAKTPDELTGSDLGPGPTNWLKNNAFRSITLVGRSPVQDAKFDAVMVKELGKLSRARFVADVADGDDPKAAAVRGLLALEGRERELVIRVLFGHTPLALEGRQAVEATRFSTPDGEVTIACSSVITAIGFETEETLRKDGVYATGWCAKGPRGTIAEARAEAGLLAAQIMADLETRPARKMPNPLEKMDKIVPYEGWTQIDRAETNAPPPGRCRQKLTTCAAMLTRARVPQTEPVA